MGISNMQVQQSTQQGAGKGIGQTLLQGRQQPGMSGAPMGQIPQLDPSMTSHTMGQPGGAGQPDPIMTSYMPQQMQVSRMQGQQPNFGQPNRYSNTMPSWDNASIKPSQQGGGKIGKGGGSQSGYPIANTNTKYTPPPMQTAATAATAQAAAQDPAFSPLLGY
jgi:hypothetical protein